MKCTIFTMTSGEGHNRIAKAVAEEFERRSVQCKIINIFRHDGIEYRFNDWGYRFVCERFPRSYDYFWKKLKFRSNDKRYTGIAQKEIERAADKVAAQVEDCDFFLCVHPYCAVLCDYWKRTGRFSQKTYALLTDILPHPLWESAVKCDVVLTPTPHAREQLIQKGFSPEQIKVCGFPVDKKFVTRQDKAQARKQLGLQDKFTVLVASGGYGIGKNYKVAKLLSGEVQVICANGRNKRAFERTAKLQKRNGNLVNLGFVDNMDSYMDAADVAVTRAGATTLFECMSKGLPVVIRENAIINERENAEVLEKEGCAVRLKRLKDVQQTIACLTEEKRGKMRDAGKALTQGKCVADLCEFVLRDASKQTNEISGNRYGDKLEQ